MIKDCERKVRHALDKSDLSPEELNTIIFTSVSSRRKTVQRVQPSSRSARSDTGSSSVALLDAKIAQFVDISDSDEHTN